jgi:hypothetical protein
LAILGPVALIIAGVVIRTGVFAPATVQRLLWHPTCQWTVAGSACSQRATDVDHIRPKVHGGADDASNVRS